MHIPSTQAEEIREIAPSGGYIWGTATTPFFVFLYYVTVIKGLVPKSVGGKK